MPEQPTILLIEDEANLRHNLRVLLEGEGYRVVSAEDGAEGIRKIQEEAFDLVITDVVMPEVDGFQVMEYLRDYAPDVVVVTITAYASTESAIEALRRGAYDYLAKPFDVDLMQIVVKRALEKARMQKAFHQSMGELERQVAERTRNLVEAKINLERSIEELRATQEQLVQTERFRALGEVTASVAHDLGDSLAMIVGFAHVLAKTAPAEGRMKAQLEQIGAVALGCHEIVKGLVNFPWKPASEKVQTQLNAVCEEMLAGLTYQADLSHIIVERRLDNSLPPIMADPTPASAGFHQHCPLWLPDHYQQWRRRPPHGGDEVGRWRHPSCLSRGGIWGHKKPFRRASQPILDHEGEHWQPRPQLRLWDAQRAWGEVGGAQHSWRGS